VIAVARQPVQPVSVCLDCAAVLHVDEVSGLLVDWWGQAERGASCRAHAADVPVLPAGPAAPANRIPDRRTEYGGLIWTGGAWAVPAPTVPHQGRCGFASAFASDLLRRALTQDTQQRR
jgi:hypothetical protein